LNVGAALALDAQAKLSQLGELTSVIVCQVNTCYTALFVRGVQPLFVASPCLYDGRWLPFLFLFFFESFEFFMPLLPTLSLRLRSLCVTVPPSPRG